MFDLLQKTYEWEILNQQFIFKQLSYYDCLETHYKISQEWFDITWRVYWLLQEQIAITKKDMNSIDINTFLDVYMNKAMKWFYSRKSNEETMPFEAYIALLSKELNIDPIRLLKSYTPEAINFLTEWILRNINSQTKEWQKINKIKSMKKEVRQWGNEDDLKSIIAAREKRTKKNLDINK